MGKRKKSSKKPQGPKKRETLSTAFPCLFCNHDDSVTVKMDKKTGTGELSCKRCGQKFQTRINYLSAAVDVYADWIDACDAVAQDAAEPAAGRQLENSYHGLAAGYGGRDSQLQSDQHLMPSLEADDGYPEDYDEG